ncbi:D-ornithine 4,5-aminomutase subunit alpha [Austwickia sp. TVS 96-490-7B]|uniref:D-ornithine 4,5-aminomutase subunit OraS n=1 Tax=Austwickia sp. TVS 96-490-7B TaxID=2830843 RepID=UPI001D8273D8|nr:D-ornithine 4,5-aminomutase subunit OraS [Austwickia sp. TVS 96-490-7B]MBW3084308.1 D-ornithine 4,5-aminomutase subunit alpha [Austwickia sp. TVS 96-490-7B]
MSQPTSDRMVAYEARRAELSALSDEELKNRFWQLADQAVAPLVDLARSHTSPSIERSVLLRMGVDSVSSHGVVDRIAEAGLLGKGAGHVLVRLARRQGTDVRGAAAAILSDASCLDGLFPTGGAR